MVRFTGVNPTATYKIHDNGGVPFIVYVYAQERRVSIVGNGGDPRYDSLSMQYLEIFPGVDPDEPDYLGNTVLLQIAPRIYYYIGGRDSFLFKTDDKIVEYFSPIGNSDVPYPYAVGTRNVYLMIEDGYIGIDKFEKQGRVPADPYSIFYKHVPNQLVWFQFKDTYLDKVKEMEHVLENIDTVLELEKENEYLRSVTLR